jgi:hypothetical protein
MRRLLLGRCHAQRQQKEMSMKLKILLGITMLAMTAGIGYAGKQTVGISGDYLEVRSCDVYTGPCFANAEMGLSGKEGILVWSIREGAWKGTSLKGLGVIAVVSADATLGDVRHQPRSGKAVLIVDAKADSLQREALMDFARSMAGHLIKEVAEVKTVGMELAIGACTKAGCAKVDAGDLVQISTRCFSEKDHVCGNEETYYPPLTQVDHAMPAFTELASYQGTGLNLTWQSTENRGAFLASFSR